MSTDVNGFLARFSGQPIPVATASTARRVRDTGVDITHYDANGNGALDTMEQAAYFTQLRRTLGEPRIVRENGRDVSRDPVQPVVEALTNLPPARLSGRDPFEPNVVLPTGRYRGERVDTSVNRSARVLTPAEAVLYGAKPGEIVVANFRHDERFWIIRIPADAVESVTVQRVNFDAPVPAAHAQTRFTLRADRPAIIVPQVAGDNSQPRALRELVLSIEATSVPGQKYGVFEGMKGTFVNAYRLTSLEDRYNDSVVRGKQTVQQYAVKADNATLNRILRSGVDYATERGMSEVYHTLWRNCSLGAFNYIDRAIGFDRNWTAFRGVYPVWIDGYMWRRGLLDASRPLPNLEVEFADPPAVHGRTEVPLF